ncbi:hypothetical protein [Persephonella sp.]
MRKDEDNGMKKFSFYELPEWLMQEGVTEDALYDYYYRMLPKPVNLPKSGIGGEIDGEKYKDLLWSMVYHDRGYIEDRDYSGYPLEEVKYALEDESRYFGNMLEKLATTGLKIEDMYTRVGHHAVHLLIMQGRYSFAMGFLQLLDVNIKERLMGLTPLHTVFMSRRYTGRIIKTFKYAGYNAITTVGGFMEIEQSKEEGRYEGFWSPEERMARFLQSVFFETNPDEIEEQFVNGKKALITWLLERGANPLETDYFGRDVIDWARFYSLEMDDNSLLEYMLNEIDRLAIELPKENREEIEMREKIARQMQVIQQFKKRRKIMASKVYEDHPEFRGKKIPDKNRQR